MTESEPAAQPKETGAVHPVLVRLPTGACVAPMTCACCNEAASERSAAPGPGELLVGYCRPCLEHVARASTHRLAALLASMLLAGSLAISLPIALPSMSVYQGVATTWIGALLPIAVAAWNRRRRAGHVAMGAAVWFRAPRELVTWNAQWAAQLVTSAGGEFGPTAARKPLLAAELGIVAAAAAASVLLHFHYHPRVRVVNGNDVPIIVTLDGRALGRVEPNVLESPAAGLSTRVPAGARELVASAADDGREIGRARVHALPGREHLFAPGAPEVCFWLERQAYGRAQPTIESARLEGDQRFWVVPEDVLGWFVPSAPPEEGARTTGGTTTVLRQGPCDESPDRR